MQMSKLIQGIVLASLVAPVCAGEFYLGAGVGLFGSGTESATVKVFGYGSADADEDFSPSSFEVKGGYRLDSGNRFEITSAHISVDYDNDYSSESYSGLDFDFLWTFGEDSLKPYLGAGLGLYTYDDFRDVNGDELNGLSLNLMGGATYDINERFGVDVGLKLRSIGWQKMRFYSDGYSAEVELTSSVLLVGAGANIYF